MDEIMSSSQNFDLYLSDILLDIKEEVKISSQPLILKKIHASFHKEKMTSAGASPIITSSL